MARNTSKTLFCNPLLGDREKPGAKREAELILLYYVPHEPLSRWIPPWAPKQKQSSLAPGFSWSLNSGGSDRNCRSMASSNKRSIKEAFGTNRQGSRPKSQRFGFQNPFVIQGFKRSSRKARGELLALTFSARLPTTG